MKNADLWFGSFFAAILAGLFCVVALGAVVASLHKHRHVTAGSLPGDEPPAVHDPPTVPDDEAEPAPIPSPSS